MSLAATSLVLSVGCGIDVGVGGSTGEGGHSTGGCSTGDGSSGVGGAPDYTTSAVTGGGVVTVGAGGSAPGKVCGGFIGATCAADEYCDHIDNSCGYADGSGFCKKRPSACDANLDPTCGCDGEIYSNECGANVAGQDVAEWGNCQPPAGQFACGAHFCNLKTQYCERTISNSDTPSVYTCIDVPAACNGTATCACLSGAPCGQDCAVTPTGGVKVTCPDTTP